jgi:hypothetical protein
MLDHRVNHAKIGFSDLNFPTIRDPTTRAIPTFTILFLIKILRVKSDLFVVYGKCTISTTPGTTCTCRDLHLPIWRFPKSISPWMKKW